MLDIVKRASAGMGLLMILPLLARMYHWYGQPEAWWTQPLYWISLTSSWPWVIITQIAFCGWFLWCLRLRMMPGLMLCLLLCAALFVAQGGKMLVKSQVREPPPHVVWQHMSAEQFHHMSHEQREGFLDQLLLAQKPGQPALTGNWQKASDRAFPSGFALFAAFWVLMSMVILSPSRHSTTQVVILVWGELMMLSLLLLDMSWPRDLLASVILAWIVSTVTGYLIWRFFPKIME